MEYWILTKACAFFKCMHLKIWDHSKLFKTKSLLQKFDPARAVSLTISIFVLSNGET